MFIPPTRAIARRIVTKRMGQRLTVMTAGQSGLGGLGGFTFGTGNPFGHGSASRTTGPNPFGQRPNDVIDVDHVHVERIDPDELPHPRSEQ